LVSETEALSRIVSGSLGPRGAHGNFSSGEVIEGHLAKEESDVLQKQKIQVRGIFPHLVLCIEHSLVKDFSIMPIEEN
jgi:hypothetical protein